MSFGDAITSFWTNYVNFTGRARRSEYWFITLFLLLTNIGATIIDGAFVMDDLDVFFATGGWGPAGFIWALAVLLPSLSVLARRLHDSDRSAWWILIGLLPVAGVIVLFVFSVMDSSPGQNKYGRSPKEASAGPPAV